MERLKSRLLRLRADFAPLVERAVITRRIYGLLLEEIKDYHP